MRALRIFDFNVKPGIYTNATDRGAKGRWKSGDHLRFRDGLPEKIGGARKVALSGAQVVGDSAGIIHGKARAVHDWTALDNTKHSAIGTHEKLYLVVGGLLYDITPLRDTRALTDPFAMTDGSAEVVVTDAGHGAVANDYVTFSGATAVGGITISGNYQISEVVSGDTYKIVHNAAATATASGGGTVTAQYEIPAGISGDASASGWGVGAWGSGPWGEPRELSEDESNTIQEIRIWSLDNWGEDLIASPRSGRIYVWDKTGGPSQRAVLIENSPQNSNRVIVSQEERILISVGSHDGSARDQLLIRWCARENYNDWKPVITNRAGDNRMNEGSRAVAVVKTKSEHVIFTDSAMFSLRFIGGNDVYELRKLASNVSIASPNAAVEINGVLFVMGKNNFYIYDGTVRELKCDIWTQVFGDFNVSKSDRVFAGTNQLYSEIRWFYPSALGEDNNRCAIFNFKERVWYPQTIARTCWHDYSTFLRKPYAVTVDGWLARHEDGDNDIAADGSATAVTSYIESWDTEIGAGESLMHVGRLIPDFDELVGDGTVTLKSRRYPTEAQLSDGPYTVGETTTKVDVRTRNRQVALRWEQSGLSKRWRMGTWRMEARPHGGR